jgi:diketogulonate reductase-like aldo/keto reductase
LMDNLGAFEVSLSDEDLSRIDRVAPPASVTSSYHNGDWGPNLFRW